MAVPRHEHELAPDDATALPRGTYAAGVDREKLYRHVLASPIISGWHFFRYHFQFRLVGGDHPFAEAIVAACLDCERAIPGFASRMMDELAAIGGRENHTPDFEQLMQRLAELLVIRQLARFDWPDTPTFAWEPTAGQSKKNPEVTVTVGGQTLGVEVKTPSLVAHRRARSSNPLQLPARDVVPFERAREMRGGNVTLPRDNPVKDFLISADAKFASFREAGQDFCGLLVIVWDGAAYEAIDALIHPAAGLLTPRSFAMADGEALTFANVDGVIVTPQLEQLGNASSDRGWPGSPIDALDWGRPREYPFKPFLANPNGRPVDELWLEALQAVPYSPALGAEYAPMDMVAFADIGDPQALAKADARMLELVGDTVDLLRDQAPALPGLVADDVAATAGRLRELLDDESREAGERWREAIEQVAALAERLTIAAFPSNEGELLTGLVKRLELVAGGGKAFA